MNEGHEQASYDILLTLRIVGVELFEMQIVSFSLIRQMKLLYLANIFDINIKQTKEWNEIIPLQISVLNWSPRIQNQIENILPHPEVVIRRSRNKMLRIQCK